MIPVPVQYTGTGTGTVTVTYNRLLQSHLLRHGRQGLFIFKCDVCGIGFVCEDHLKIHKETPGLCKQNKCATCSVVLGSYQELKAHRVNEHGGLEERK